MKPAERELLKQAVEFRPLAPYTREGMVTGFQLPDGNIIMNMNERTSGATMGLYKNQLSADYVLIKGLWTFQPAMDSIQILGVSLSKLLEARD